MDNQRTFIHSPYLAGGVPRRLRLHARRALCVSAGVLAAGLLCAAIANTWFSVDGWAYALYWLHDHVYLYLEGHLWTRFFPLSLIWMLPVAGAAIYVYINGCVRGPLWLSPHASAILVASRFRATRTLLHRWCWLVGRRNWGWRFIFNVIEQEIETGFDGIVSGSTSPRHLDALAELSMLPASLSRIASDAPAANAAVELLYEALVVRRVFGSAEWGRLDRMLSVNLRKLLKGQPRREANGAPDLSSARRSTTGERERCAADRLLTEARQYLATGPRSAASDSPAKNEDPLARQVRDCLEFSDTLDALLVVRERERIVYRVRGEPAAESDRTGSDRLRACLMHAYLVAHAAGEPALARAVHTRLEGYLLASSLAGLDSNGARGVFRARDFGTLNRLLQPRGEQVAMALRQVRKLDESVFAEHDLLAPARQAALLKLSAGWSEDG